MYTVHGSSMYSVHCTVFVISPIIAACPDIILRSALAEHDPKQEEEDGDDDDEDFDNDDDEEEGLEDDYDWMIE